MQGNGNPHFNLNAAKPRAIMCYICGREWI
jgi:hypothetical protein